MACIQFVFTVLFISIVNSIHAGYNYSTFDEKQHFPVNTSSIICAFETFLQENYYVCQQSAKLELSACNENMSFEIAQDNFKILFNASNVGFVNINFQHCNIAILEDSLSDNLQKLFITNCTLDNVNIESNKTCNNLKTLNISDNKIIGDVRFNKFRLSDTFPNLHKLSVTGNSFRDSSFVAVMHDISQSNSIEYLNLRNNGLTFIPRLPGSLLQLEIMDNLIAQIENTTFENLTSLKLLNFSNNHLTTLEANCFTSLSKLETIDLSKNFIASLNANTFRFLLNLKNLILSNNPLNVLPAFPALVNVRFIDFSGSHIRVLELDVLTELRRLEILKIDNVPSLRSIVGEVALHVPNLEKISAKSCSLKTLSGNIFRNIVKPIRVDFSRNQWPCDCRLLWASRLPSNLEMISENATFCYTKDNAQILISNFSNTLNVTQCESANSVHSNGTIFRTTYSQSILLDCGAFGDPWPMVTWRRADTDTEICAQGATNVTNDDGEMVPYPDGTLFFKGVYRNHVGLYQCVITNARGNNTLFMKLRLSYAYNWWFIKICSVICGFLTGLAFFALNVIHGAIRRLIIWRLSKLRQTSRMRCLLESLEKYRQRQMDYLHEMYSSNMNQVRENYHQQVDQLRKGYSTQAERFRDYRAAQLESVAQHIDSVRDNYATQVNRLREYGSKQMERLWESYQQRVSRLRDFSLQQRLRLMEHYKVKQHYLNKVLENLNMESCRNPGRRSSRTFTGPEQIEMPPMPPENDLPTSTAYDLNSENNFLNDPKSLYFEKNSSRSLNKIVSSDPAKQQKYNDTIYDDDDDASSYHSFPEDLLFYVEEMESNNSERQSNQSKVIKETSTSNCNVSPKLTKETIV